MVKEKYLPLILAISILFSIVIIITGFVAIGSEGYEASEPEYVSKIFDKDSVVNIDIQIDQEQWDYMIQNALSEEYVPCDIVINGEKYQTVGIRPKGNSSLSMVAGSSENDRFSFRVDFSQYVKGQTMYGLNRMSLNNMIGDASYMKEYLSYEMFSNMGVNTPVYAYANITINSEPWGLYLAVEIMEEDYLERNYGSDYGNLYKPDGSKMIKNEDENGNGIPPEMPKGVFQKMAGQRPPMGMMRPSGNMQQSQFGQMPPAAMTGESTSTGFMPGGQPPADFPQDSDMTGNNMFGGGMQPPEGIPGQNPGMTTPDGTATTGNASMQAGNFGGMMGRNSNGTDLVYVDDDISSYSDIFDYTITKVTSDSDKKRLIRILKNLNSGENLENSIDVDEVLRYFAVNTFLVNLDSYVGNTRHNYYIYEKDGIMEILPWDLNLSFGGFQISDSSKVVNFPIDAPTTVSMETSPLISKLLEVDEYKERYHQYLYEIVEKYYENGEYSQEIDRLDALIGEYVKNDATSFFTYEQYTAAIEELKKYYQERSKGVSAQLSGEQPATEYGGLQTDLNLRTLGTMGGGGDRGERNEGDFADFQGGRNGMPDMAQMGMNPFANNMNGFPARNTVDTGTQAGTNPTETTAARIRNVATETDSRTVLNSSNLFGLITLAISALSIIAGCVFAKLYRRKRYRTK